jgi:hypothetical protein
VPVLLGGARLSLPRASVLVSEAPESYADDARRAGLERAGVPELQGVVR